MNVLFRRLALTVLLVGILVASTAIGHAEPSPSVPAGGFGGECCCDFPVDCGNGSCCPANNTCNPFNPAICCPPNLPVACANTCCPAGGHCNPDGSCGTSCPPGFPVDCGTGICCPANNTCNPLNPILCCPPNLPVACANTCCPAGGVCSADGNSCEASCPPGFPVDCGNGRCCPSDRTCNPVNPGICCLANFPIPCANTCCPAGSQCSADGNSCVTPNPCSNPDYPVNCGNGFCCPGGDRCAPVLIGDVIYPYCCLDLPAEGCCPSGGGPTLAESLGGTTIAVTNSRGGSTCRKSTKVRPFEVLQISAGSTGAPGSFDAPISQYSVGFALSGGKGGRSVVLKVPVIEEDSNGSSLSVMIPPFLLNKKSHGKATVFLIANGVMSETCLSKVRIAKLPRSASKVPGLVTHSWLRANQAVQTMGKSALESAAAAPFLDAEIRSQVGSVSSYNATPIQAFDPSINGGAKKGELKKTAKQSDSLITGMLLAGQTVSDAAYAGSVRTWVQALSTAKDGNDGALQAAEAAYATTFLGASGPSAPAVAKFTVACGAVTTATIGASAALVRGGANLSATIDAQVAATTICGATISASVTVCGLTAITTGAGTPGRTTYGKILLRGGANIGAAARTNYGGINLASAKVCGCRQPRVKELIDISITIIVTCDRIRSAAPRICYPDVPATPIPNGHPLCGNGFIESGEDCDPAISGGCGSGQACESCRCVGTGDVRVTLSWGTADDLDLHVIDPSGEEIYYSDKTSASGGELDVDSNAGCTGPEPRPVENIFWNAGEAPRGTYRVYVDYYQHCGSEDPNVPFSVKLLVDGVETFLDGVLSTPDFCGACTECDTCSEVRTFTR